MKLEAFIGLLEAFLRLRLTRCREMIWLMVRKKIGDADQQDGLIRVI